MTHVTKLWNRQSCFRTSLEREGERPSANSGQQQEQEVIGGRPSVQIGIATFRVLVGRLPGSEAARLETSQGNCVGSIDDAIAVNVQSISL